MTLSWPFVAAAPGSGWELDVSASLALELRKPFSASGDSAGAQQLPEQIDREGWARMLVRYRLSPTAASARPAFQVPGDGRLAIARRQGRWLLIYLPWNPGDWAVWAGKRLARRHYGNAMILSWEGLEDSSAATEMLAYALCLNAGRGNRLPVVGDDGQVCYVFPDPSDGRAPCEGNLPIGDADLRGLEPAAVISPPGARTSPLDLVVARAPGGAEIRVRDLSLPVKKRDVIGLAGLAPSPAEVEVGFAYVPQVGLGFATDRPWAWVDVDKLLVLLAEEGLIETGPGGGWRQGLDPAPYLIGWYEKDGPLATRLSELRTPSGVEAERQGFRLYNPPEAGRGDSVARSSTVSPDVLTLTSEGCRFLYAGGPGSGISYGWRARLFTLEDVGSGVEPSFNATGDEFVLDEPGLDTDTAQPTIFAPDPVGRDEFIRVTGGVGGGASLGEPHSALLRALPDQRPDRVYFFLRGGLTSTDEWFYRIAEIAPTDVIYTWIAKTAETFTKPSKVAERLAAVANALAGVRLHVCAWLRPDPSYLRFLDKLLREIRSELSGLPLSSVVFDTETEWLALAGKKGEGELRAFAAALKAKTATPGSGFEGLDLYVTEAGFPSPKTKRRQRQRHLIEACDGVIPQVYSGRRKLRAGRVLRGGPGERNGITRGWAHFRDLEGKEMILALSAQSLAQGTNVINNVNAQDMHEDLRDALGLDRPRVAQLAYWPDNRLINASGLEERLRFVSDVCAWAFRDGEMP